MTSAKGMSVLLNAAKYLGEAYGLPAHEAIAELNEAHSRLLKERKLNREGIVSVYRQYQMSMISPCQHPLRPENYEQCEMCAQGKVRNCQRKEPAEPAFTLTISKAMIFVRHGLATFIDDNTALRLTFSKIAQLRDMSLKINERFLLRLVEGDRRAIAAMEGWTQYVSLPYRVIWPAEQMAASREQIQCFA